MKTFSTFLSVLLCLFSLPGFGQVRTGGVYTITAETLGSGGRQTTTSTTYTGDATVGTSPAGISTVGVYTTKAGYIGQLYDVVGLEVTNNPISVNEGATTQLKAESILDDDTRLEVPATDVTWSVVGASPIVAPIPTNGLATANNVHAATSATSATVRGDLGAENDEFVITVNNITEDDMGLYAGDGIDDAWQVLYFGVGTNGQGTAEGQASNDADKDGDDNEFEFLAGYVPNDLNSRFQYEFTSLVGTTATLTLSKVIPGTRYKIYGKTDKDVAFGAPLTTIDGLGTEQADHLRSQFRHGRNPLPLSDHLGERVG
ncbi:MAG: hypothetical protein ACI9R3_004499 [Verrucomicrobiales bacterium]